jgi:hypothetical protein
MKKEAIIFLAAVVAAATMLIAGAAPERTLAVTHVSLIDATGTPAQPDMTVIIVGQRIVSIEKSATAKIPGNAQVVAANGKYLIPGLWDMHVHEIFGDWLPENEKIIPLLFVANGITGVRDMGGDLEPLKKWRTRAASGDMIAPRMVISGPMLDGPVPRFPSSAPIKDAVDGRRVVDELITPSTKLMTLFSGRRIGRGVRENSSSPTWAEPA